MINALYIGGPTAIIETGGFRFITDPTFDPAGSKYSLAGGAVLLEKSQGPANVDPGKIDFVLLSHDQHSDNLDNRGRALLAEVTRTYSTKAAARRLTGTITGLDPWETDSITAPDGTTITLTATPARHGPAGIEKIAGDVIGFILPSTAKAGRKSILLATRFFMKGYQPWQKNSNPNSYFFLQVLQERGDPLILP